ncbi:methyltransferase domain-containing protein [Plectosphaerella plurivora]|uniref:Methyltransferase domain-containing protein n=1 Tax=Plectosphaerella plurivora TaxID=936078 RepID=A0A9P9ABE1_9PEZI|nr:methyltransferase domain-containing protein [Plectosphaerella plurivora]
MTVMTQNGAASGAPFFEENGRQYGTFRRGRYLFPIDEEEKERLDCFHAVIHAARRHRHWDRPVPDGARVLDLGTGTGIWAIDASDALWKSTENHGQILGLDLAYIQPATVPSTVEFRQQDIEEPWQLSPNEFDMVHIQMLLGSIRDWTELYRKAFRHLKPGGSIEHIEIEFKFFSDDNSVPPDASMHIWSNTLHRAMHAAGVPMDITERTKQDLRAAGFVDITESVINLPVSPWGKDPHDIFLGRAFNHGLTSALEAMSMAPFTRIERWPAQDVARLNTAVKKELCMLRHHAYCRLFIWTAQKPNA